MFHRYQLRHSRTLAVNLEGLTDVPDEVFKLATAENVHVVDFARNQLSALPNGWVILDLCHAIYIHVPIYFSLRLMGHLVTELVLSHNAIVEVHPFISQFTRISYINLSNNLLSDLPNEFGVLNTLRELNISNNR